MTDLLEPATVDHEEHSTDPDHHGHGGGHDHGGHDDHHGPTGILNWLTSTDH